MDRLDDKDNPERPEGAINSVEAQLEKGRRVLEESRRVLAAWEAEHKTEKEADREADRPFREMDVDKREALETYRQAYLYQMETYRKGFEPWLETIEASAKKSSDEIHKIATAAIERLNRVSLSPPIANADSQPIGACDHALAEYQQAYDRLQQGIRATVASPIANADPQPEQLPTTKQRLLGELQRLSPEEKALHEQLFYHAKREKRGSFPADAVLISEATKTRLDNFESLSADEQAEVLRQLPLLNVPALEPKPAPDTDVVHRLSKKAKAKLEMPHEQRCLVEAVDRARATVLKSKGKIPSNKLLSQFKADLEKSAHVNKVPSLIDLKKYCRKENVETIIDDYNDYAAKKIQPNGKRYSRARPGTLAQKFMADAWRLQPGTVKTYTNEGKKDKNRNNSH